MKNLNLRSSLVHPKESKAINKKELIDGITNRLLEKYKPNRSFSAENIRINREYTKRVA